MSNIATIVSSPSVAAPTERQIQRLIALGVPMGEIPKLRSDASKMIERRIAERDMKPATPAQVGRAGALGGRDLPGAGVREKSTQIYLLEALVVADNCGTEDKFDALMALAERVRERFVKPMTVTITAPVSHDDAPM